MRFSGWEPQSRASAEALRDRLARRRSPGVSVCWREATSRCVVRCGRGAGQILFKFKFFTHSRSGLVSQLGHRTMQLRYAKYSSSSYSPARAYLYAYTCGVEYFITQPSHARPGSSLSGVQ
eukprot:1271206-Pleurochrysis_carterae.AAC.3